MDQISDQHALVQLLIFHIRRSKGQYIRNVSLSKQFPIVQTLQLVRSTSKAAYKIMHDCDIFPMCEKVARKLQVPTFFPGINDLAIDYLLQRAQSKKIEIVLSTDAIALKPGLGIVDNVIVGASKKEITASMIPNFDVSTLSYSKCLMVFQASLVHAPDLNVTIAIFDYEKSGFDHMALRQTYDSIVRRLQERCQEQKVEMKIVLYI